MCFLYRKIATCWEQCWSPFSPGGESPCWSASGTLFCERICSSGFSFLPCSAPRSTALPSLILLSPRRASKNNHSSSWSTAIKSHMSHTIIYSPQRWVRSMRFLSLKYWYPPKRHTTTTYRRVTHLKISILSFWASNALVSSSFIFLLPAYTLSIRTRVWLK